MEKVHKVGASKMVWGMNNGPGEVAVEMHGWEECVQSLFWRDLHSVTVKEEAGRG